MSSLEASGKIPTTRLLGVTTYVSPLRKLFRATVVDIKLWRASYLYLSEPNDGLLWSKITAMSPSAQHGTDYPLDAPELTLR
jgi:hypothetical protein